MTAVDTLLAQAANARREHRPEDAKRDLIEAVALCRESPHRGELAQALAALGQIERDLHDFAASRKAYEEAVRLFHDARNPRVLAHTVRHLGDVLQEIGDLTGAEECYGEALDLYRRDAFTGPLELANAVRSAAILRDRLGEKDRASSLWAEARDLYVKADVQAGVTECTRRIVRANRGDLGL